ncbi:MAG: hypothetical protein WD600_06215 [Pseudohongiella sp.]
MDARNALTPRPLTPRPMTARYRTLVLVTLAVSCVLLAGCARKFSVSVNQNVLYDPRPTHVVAVADAGLQSCINVAMRERDMSSGSDVQIIACPTLQIETLAGIEQLDNLRYLDLADNWLEHLDELRNMTRLSSVNAPDNALNDISGLLSVTSLTSVVLSGNNAIPCDQLDALEQRLGSNLIRPQRCAE